ncbi:GlxA family transcriptional regulator [Sphingomonas sp. ASY06-1R]|uniref:GlxA family transcriptional regulator n=1 Tax=Sphingomonas sp. ASY06-1R TaxID=3445771 RepID=UPI003FA32E4C
MKRIGLIVIPGFQVIGLTAFSAFEVANKRAGETLYALHVLSEHGGTVRSSFGLDVVTEPLDGATFDTLIVAAGLDVPPAVPGLATYLRAAVPVTRRLASICLGSFVLGEAGLLDGRRATTHWRYADQLGAHFPATTVEPDRLFVKDGPIWTSAGMSAAIDLAVGMIESDHGVALAREVAQSLVMEQRRSGGQPQRSALLDLDARSDRIQNALAYARTNLRQPLQIEDLAQAACLSPRQFRRLFRAETGTTPGQALDTLRIEAAKVLLDQSRLPIEEVAREAGFGNRERMRRAFLRHHGEVPQAIRAAAGPLVAA